MSINWYMDKQKVSEVSITVEYQMTIKRNKAVIYSLYD